MNGIVAAQFNPRQLPFAIPEEMPAIQSAIGLGYNPASHAGGTIGNVRSQPTFTLHRSPQDFYFQQFKN
jgi:hypothetical protein